MDWITKIFDYTVVKHEIPRPGGKAYYPLGKEADGIGCLHTTEGSTAKGAVATLSANCDAPHFIVGSNQIIQCRPLGVQAAALHAPANQFCALQIESVGFSKQALWMPDDSTKGPLVALMAWANMNLGIPLERPNPAWKDGCTDMKGEIWASNNSRRRSGTFPSHKGWFGHLEVTNQGNSWHWDPGALNWTDLFQAAKELVAK